MMLYDYLITLNLNNHKRLEMKISKCPPSWRFRKYWLLEKYPENVYQKDLLVISKL